MIGNVILAMLEILLAIFRMNAMAQLATQLLSASLYLLSILNWQNLTIYWGFFHIGNTQVDKYFTVQPHTLIRQHLDYSHWYDRTKLTLKDIHNTQYLSCMNPTSGSFTIDPRLQRHFSVFALSFPVTDALQTIYSNILMQHFITGNFPVRE